VWHRLRVELAPVIAELARAGFDLVQPFPTAEIAREPGLARLADPARPFGLLVANTRALWPRFLAARAADPSLAAAADPVDRYTEHVLGPLAASLGGEVLYSHATYDGVFLPFQRLAVAAGLAALSPTQLVIHPEVGPWLALRAAILSPGAPPPRAAPVSLPCTCASTCHAAFAHACAHPADWRAWVAVRDACPVGRSYRYSEDQLAYHYSKDHQYLR
jgi:methylmalonic aciduria homocystinuria type C protein